MPNPTSPLAMAMKSGRFGAQCAKGEGVAISEHSIENLVQIAGWGDFKAAVSSGLKQLGFNDVGGYRTSQGIDDIRLFRTAPDRILIMGQPIGGFSGSLTDNNLLAVLDLSHSRTRIVIEGAEVEQVLARLAPIDFRAAAMPIDSFVQTGIHHIGVLIHRTSEIRFEILVPVTWARSVWELICLNATPFGYNVEAAA